METRQGLKEDGYVFEHEYAEGNDHTGVWTNRSAGRAVRIVWLEIDTTEPPAGGLA